MYIPVFPWGQGGRHVCWRLLFLLYNIFITDRTEAVCTIVWIETAPIAAQYRMLFHVVWFLIHFVLWFFSFLFFPVSKSIRWLFLLISRHFLQMKINFDISFSYFFGTHLNLFLIFWGRIVLNLRPLIFFHKNLQFVLLKEDFSWGKFVYCNTYIYQFKFWLPILIPNG